MTSDTPKNTELKNALKAFISRLCSDTASGLRGEIDANTLRQALALCDQLRTANETIARLERERNHFEAAYKGADQMVILQEAQLATKEAELLACRADAERIDWLINNLYGQDITLQERLPRIQSEYQIILDGRLPDPFATGHTLRAALTAAIKAGAQS